MKAVLFLLLMLGLIFFASASDFSFSSDFSVMSVNAKEQVFLDYNGDEHLLSELLWNPGDVSLVGLSASFKIAKVLVDVDASFMSQDLSGGYMEDYDFLNLGSSSTTHFSRHDVSWDTYLEIFVKAGWDFSFSSIHIVPSLGWYYLHRKWSSYDGYTQYPVTPDTYYDPQSGSGFPYPYYTGDEPKTPLSGLVIDYEQELMCPVVSLPVSIENLAVFSFYLEPYIGIYPILYTLDNHYLRDIVFLDRMLGGLLAGVELRVDVALTDFMSVYGGYSLRYIDMLHGTSNFKKNGVWYTALNGLSGMTSFSDVFFMGVGLSF